MGTDREEQFEYSEQMAAMLDESMRRRKGAKILAVLRHALGQQDLTGLRALDVGCSAGFIADELAQAGARTTGVDIDEPALTRARASFGHRADFELARGDALPFEDGAMDVVVLNHIYEHVVDPEAVVADVYRVLSQDGVLYLGLGNRLGIIEPHYRLPFLSWLPRARADWYVRAFGKADSYHEQFLTRSGLKDLFEAFILWDYTLPVLANPSEFSGDDVIPGWVARVPESVLALTLPLVPTYIWTAFKSERRPAGPKMTVNPRRV